MKATRASPDNYLKPTYIKGLKSILILLFSVMLSACQTITTEDQGFTKISNGGELSSSAKEASKSIEKPPSKLSIPEKNPSQPPTKQDTDTKTEENGTTKPLPTPQNTNPKTPTKKEPSKKAAPKEASDSSPESKGKAIKSTQKQEQPKKAEPKSATPPMIFGDKPKTPKKTPPTKNGLATGTGFFISSDGHLLTNEHVVADARELKVFVGDTAYEARIVSLNEEDDIAILKIDIKTKPLTIKTSTPLAGTEVSVLGFPNIGIQGNEIKSTFGHVNAASGLQGDKRYFQFSAEIQPGNSGSPVIDDKGFVIGVATSTLNQEAVVAQTGTLAQGVNYALKASYAEDLIENSKIDISAQTGTVTATNRVELIKQVKESVVLIVAAIGKKAKIPKTKPKTPKKAPEKQPKANSIDSEKQPAPENASTPINTSGDQIQPDGNSRSSDSGSDGASKQQQSNGNRYHFIHFDRK